MKSVETILKEGAGKGEHYKYRFDICIGCGVICILTSLLVLVVGRRPQKSDSG